MNSENKQITLCQNLLAISFYLGFAPIYYCLKRPSHPYIAHHLRQSLALFSMLIAVVILFALFVIAISYTMVYHRTLFEQYHLEPLVLTWTRRLFLCWLVCWGFALALAIARSTNVMPLVGRIMNWAWLLKACVVAVLLFYALVPITILMTLHASTMLTPDHTESPRVIMLYDDVNRYPAWIFHLGFYRMALAAETRWGEGAIVAEKITPERLETAMRQANLIFLGTHGQAQGLLINGKYFTPEDLQVPKRKRQLQYVYLAGCDSGAQRKAWEDTFAPARVITYDRLTAMLEHIWWLWVEGPRVLQSLEEPPKKNQEKKKHQKTPDANANTTEIIEPLTR